jgi:hypothetical protein
MARAKVLVGAAVSFVAASILVDPLLFRWLIAPRLSEPGGTSLLWWLAAYSPLLIAALCFGWATRGAGEVVIVALMGSVISHVIVTAGATAPLPGTLGSLASSAPFEYWGLILLARIGAFLVVVGGAHLLGRGIRALVC